MYKQLWQFLISNPDTEQHLFILCTFLPFNPHSAFELKPLERAVLKNTSDGSRFGSNPVCIPRVPLPCPECVYCSQTHLMQPHRAVSEVVRCDEQMGGASFVYTVIILSSSSRSSSPRSGYTFIPPPFGHLRIRLLPPSRPVNPLFSLTTAVFVYFLVYVCGA